MKSIFFLFFNRNSRRIVWTSAIYGTTHLSVSVYTIRRPAARFHLIRVQTPKFQFVLKQRPTNVCRVVEFARPVKRKPSILNEEMK